MAGSAALLDSPKRAGDCPRQPQGIVATSRKRLAWTSKFLIRAYIFSQERKKCYLQRAMITATAALVKRDIMPLLATATLTDARLTHIITINPSQKVRIKKARGFPIK